MGDLGLIPGLGRSPGEGNSFPLQYSCLENSMDRAAWQATVHEAAKSWTQLSNFKEKKKREREILHGVQHVKHNQKYCYILAES